MSPFEQEQGEERPLPSPAEPQGSPVNDRLDRAQQAEIGRYVVGGVHFPSIVSAPRRVLQLGGSRQRRGLDMRRSLGRRPAYLRERPPL